MKKIEDAPAYNSFVSVFLLLSVMPPYQNLHIDAAHLTSFSTNAVQFIREFEDEQEYAIVAAAIFHLLIDNIHYTIEQPDHPFHLYANPEFSMDETLHKIREHATAYLADESTFTRSLVRAFCSNGGIHREALEELLDKYYQLAVASTQ
jgi:hypothetical protein